MTLANSNFTHHCLIAMPDMEDSRFSETVTYIVKHDAEGAVGLVVNRPLELPLTQLLAEINLPILKGIEEPDAPVLYGGPVSTEAGFVLHQERGEWNSSLEVEKDYVSPVRAIFWMPLHKVKDQKIIWYYWVMQDGRQGSSKKKWPKMRGWCVLLIIVYYLN